MREKEGKDLLEIDRLVPYWYGRTKAKEQALTLLQTEFGKIVTEPIGECTGLIEAMTKGESLMDRLKRFSNPRLNEARILEIFEGLIRDLLTE